jgi:BASS family bile acid:Na+ symporter
VLILLNYSNAALTLPDAVSRQDLDFLALILFVVTALCPYHYPQLSPMLR